MKTLENLPVMNKQVLKAILILVTVITTSINIFAQLPDPGFTIDDWCEV